MRARGGVWHDPFWECPGTLVCACPQRRCGSVLQQGVEDENSHRRQQELGGRASPERVSHPQDLQQHRVARRNSVAHQYQAESSAIPPSAAWGPVPIPRSLLVAAGRSSSVIAKLMESSSVLGFSSGPLVNSVARASSASSVTMACAPSRPASPRLGHRPTSAASPASSQPAKPGCSSRPAFPAPTPGRSRVTVCPSSTHCQPAYGSTVAWFILEGRLSIQAWPSPSLHPSVFHAPHPLISVTLRREAIMSEDWSQQAARWAAQHAVDEANRLAREAAERAAEQARKDAERADQLAREAAHRTAAETARRR